MHAKFLDPHAFGLVCVADAVDCLTMKDSSGTAVREGAVLGYAWWIWETSIPATDTRIKDRKSSLWCTLERGFFYLEELYETYVCPNPSIDHIRHAKFSRLGPDSKRFRKVREVPHWYLGALATAPAAQGKGAGRLLLNWGLDQCIQETQNSSARRDTNGQVSDERRLVTLISTPAGRRLYERAGFRALCEEDGGIISINVPEVTPDNVMLWDPEGIWTEESGIPNPSVAGLKDYIKWKI